MGVAQSVEYRIVIPVVAGSIPVTHPYSPCECGGMVDALDLGSSAFGVGVQVPPLALH